jgi:CheY-like chemotaxis protein
MAKTILVADDSKTIRRVVEITFHTTGFKVVSASDGAEALSKIGELKPDLVLADVAMPGRDGYDLCAAIKSGAGTQSIPVLLLAGAFDAFDEAKAKGASANGHIKKPFDSQALITLVRDVIGMGAEAEVPLSFAATLAKRNEPAPAPTPPAPPPPAPPPHRAPPAPAFSAPAPAPAAPAFPSFGGPAFTQPVQPKSNPAVADLGVPNRPFSTPAAAPLSSPAIAAKPAFAAPTPTPPAPPPSSSPFGALPGFGQAKPAPKELVFEEPEEIEDAELVDGDGDEPIGGPTLEPPTPPSENRPRPNVDVWALAESLPPSASRSSGIEAVEISDFPHAATMPPRSSPRVASAAAPAPTPPPAVQRVAQGLAEKVAPSIAASASLMVPGVPTEQLIQIAREVIEKIAWEVVPDLAEVIIRAELERLTKD